MSTLQQRVAEVLSDSSPAYVVDDSEANVVDSIFDMLQKAEADLHAAQTRVENLKWQLAKAQEYQA
jgi:polyhydroxyalkanoate synthesis regulator phasin